MNSFFHCFTLRPLSLVLLVLVCSSVQAQPARSISECRAIEGELARFACYEALEDPAGAAATPAAPPAAAPETPPRPVSNLPVVRRPRLDVGGAAGQTGDAPAKAPVAAEVREPQGEKPGLLRRLLPFGGDDEPREADAVEPAATAVAPAAGSDVDNFGRSNAAARIETNAEGKAELIDTIAGIKMVNRNMQEVTLESGQVWRQMLSKRYPLNIGERVTIRPTRWGSAYRLTSERLSGFIQVERVD